MKQELTEARSVLAKTISDLVRLASQTVIPGITIDAPQLSKLSNLTGTPPFQALYIIDALTRTASIAGDVCEYGVATGRTSALIAATLNRLGRNKRLWLYDSFEGLPKPSTKDTMLNDVAGLGSLEGYAGYFAFAEDHVKREVQQVGFPVDRTVICKGWITQESLRQQSPEAISFAYLDMDFYQSTKDVLEFLVRKMPVGGIAILDDYGFFSSGIKTAVDEITSEHPKMFAVNQPFNDKFAVLEKLA